MSSPASSWAGSSEIIVVPGDCPDDNLTSNHRPVIARFEMQEAGPSDALMATHPSPGAEGAGATTKLQLLQRLESLEAEMRRLKELIRRLP
ncbi:MAG TPA: hypothetical protein VFT44_01865 [Pyrinomonadaceae bacterium]|nr:hypothetical protein [Pyrinomonadaceae bacterium]